MRVTRSQIHGPTVQRAQEVLQEPVPNVVVDEEKLQHLLARCVENTRDFTVDQLERLYSRLSHCVFQHRNDYDKTKLTQVNKREAICVLPVNYNEINY